MSTHTGNVFNQQALDIVKANVNLVGVSADLLTADVMLLIKLVYLDARQVGFNDAARVMFGDKVLA